MCTVSFVPLKDSVLITSNRDESVVRGLTLPTKEYWINNIKSTYPKDEKSVGTWIGYNEYNSIAVLLNGAFIKHESTPPYKKSRGLIITEILSTKNSIETVDKYDFNDIEPFTLILYQNYLLIEFRWDGKELFKKHLSTNACHLWNSATLYSNKIEKNNQLDLKLLLSNTITQKEILDFHKSKKYETQLREQSIINNIKTLSITQVVFSNEKTEMLYKDLMPAMADV